MHSNGREFGTIANDVAMIPLVPIPNHPKSEHQNIRISSLHYDQFDNLSLFNNQDIKVDLRPNFITVLLPNETVKKRQVI